MQAALRLRKKAGRSAALLAAALLLGGCASVVPTEGPTAAETEPMQTSVSEKSTTEAH